MEKLKIRMGSFDKALLTLDQILNEPFSVIVRDASIQRFVYTFETCWKAAKCYLQEVKGMSCGSPKNCFRSAGTAKLISIENVETWLAMTDDRNLTSTYIEEIATSIYNKLPAYNALMYEILNEMKRNIET